MPHRISRFRASALFMRCTYAEMPIAVNMSVFVRKMLPVKKSLGLTKSLVLTAQLRVLVRVLVGLTSSGRL